MEEMIRRRRKSYELHISCDNRIDVMFFLFSYFFIKKIAEA
jgi:hypothetical protein